MITVKIKDQTKSIALSALDEYCHFLYENRLYVKVYIKGPSSYNAINVRNQVPSKILGSTLVEPVDLEIHVTRKMAIDKNEVA